MKNKENKLEDKLNSRSKKDFEFFKYCMKYWDCKVCPKNGKGECKDDSDNFNSNINFSTGFRYTKRSKKRR